MAWWRTISQIESDPPGRTSPPKDVVTISGENTFKNTPTHLRVDEACYWPKSASHAVEARTPK